MCGLSCIENVHEEPLNLFSDDDYDRLILGIAAGMITRYKLDFTTYSMIARKLSEGVFKGFGTNIDDIGVGSADYKMLFDLRRNVYVFSGAKCYQEVRDVASLLTDKTKNEIKSFSDFKVKAKEVLTTYNETYLHAEYNSAIAQSRSASQWMEFEKESDLYPMLTYHTVGDARVRPTHQELDGISRPIGDKFWDTYMPPNGWNCYDDKTSVYTNSGWKLFSELTKEDLVYTLDTDNFNTEWQKPINYIKKEHKGSMIEIKANNFSACVTDKHKMLVRKSWDRHEKRNTLKLIDADKIAISDQIYKSSNWIGCDNMFIEIAGKRIKTDVFVMFMGWYLSEGSTTKRGGNVYQIKISQDKKKHLELIKEDLKDFPFKVYYGCDYVGINNTELGKYLKQFGKSFDKYVPNEIKQLSKDLILLFLDRYTKGDGCISKGKIRNNGYINKDNVSIYTSSKRMGDDLTELIIKSGQSCTMREQQTKGKIVKHRNGDYTTNHNMIRINILHSNYYTIQSKHVNEISYDGYVYCVEVARFNTLLVMRNGKIYWCGNCRCTTLQGDGDTVQNDLQGFKQPKDVPDIFKMNAGKDRIVFSPKHPYFNVAPKDKKYARNNFNLPIP